MRARHDLRMVPAAVAAWLGAVLLVQHSARDALVVAILALLAAGTAARRWPRFALCLGGLFIVATSVAWRAALVESSPLTSFVERSETVTVVASLPDDPRPTRGGSERWSLVVEQVERQGQQWQLRVRATGFWQPDPKVAGPVAGDKVRLRVKLSPSDRTDEAAVMQIRSWEPIGQASWWWTAAEGVRESIRVANARHGDNAAALVPALVTGDESGLDPFVREDFQRTGLTHLVAVSGSNLTIVLGAVIWLLHLVGGRRFALPLGLLVTIAFVLVARPEPSVQRAAVMGVVGLFALGRSTSPAGLRALSWAVLVLLVMDPWLGAHAGFVLSVCATAGILVLGPRLADSFEKWSPRPVALALAVPLAAQLACLPMVAALTDEVSVVSWIANLVAAVAVAPATVAGLGAGLLGLVHGSLSWIPAEIAWFAATWIVTTGQRTAAAPGAAVPWPFSSWWLVPLAAALALAFIRIGSNGLQMALLGVLMVLFVFRPVSRPWLPADSLVVACDVGQGDAFVIPLADSAGIVIDVGEFPVKVDDCLRSLRIKEVPLVVLTHNHADHVAGWAGLVRGRQVGTVLVGPSGTSGVDRPLTPTARGDVFTVGGAKVEVLWPPTREHRGSTNDQSLVVAVTVGGERLLFAGDLGAHAQRRLASETVTASVFKVPHHGSADRWPGLVELVGPRVALIGVGTDNRHGHPAPEVVTELESAGVQVLRTDLDGTFALTRKPDGWGVVRR